MTRLGDWVAMIVAIAAVLGCVAAVGVLVAGQVAGTVWTVRTLRAGGTTVADEQPLKRSAGSAALLGSAAVFVVSAWLAGDDLATRYRSGQVLGLGGWLELAGSAALAGCGVWVLAMVVRRGRAGRVACSTHRVTTVGPRSEDVG